jgi:hypothetical protein
VIRIRKELERLEGIVSIGDILQRMHEDINMAIAGLGLANPSEKERDYGMRHVERLSSAQFLKPFGIDPKKLEKQGAVGDVSYSLFRGKWSTRIDCRRTAS